LSLWSERQSRPDSGLGFHVNVSKRLSPLHWEAVGGVVPLFRGSGRLESLVDHIFQGLHVSVIKRKLMMMMMMMMMASSSLLLSRLELSDTKVYEA